MNNTQDIRVSYVENVEDILRRGDFVYESWVALCDPHGARCDIPYEDYLKKLLWFSTLPAGTATVAFFESKNGKPLGLAVLVDDTTYEARRTVNCWVAYSTPKFGGLKVMLAEGVRWAKAHGYAELHCQTKRVNGAAARFFGRKLGFTQLGMLYKKDL